MATIIIVGLVFLCVGGGAIAGYNCAKDVYKK